jgi:predicted CXXCH cytochrome family protein
MRRFAEIAAGLLACLGLLSWTADVQAAHSTYGCHNCHLPHKAATPDDPAASWGVPLWSTAQTSDGLPTFTLYGSETFNALATDITQPDGPSKLCLGCHDGSYIAFKYMPGSTAIFGPNDLAKSHPVSFTYDSALAARHPKGSLRDPAVATSGLGGTIRKDLLDDHGKMQCTSCHDVHTSGKGEFMLRYDYDVATHTDNILCRVCHDK